MCVCMSGTCLQLGEFARQLTLCIEDLVAARRLLQRHDVAARGNQSRTLRFRVENLLVQSAWGRHITACT